MDRKRRLSARTSYAILWGPLLEILARVRQVDVKFFSLFYVIFTSDTLLVAKAVTPDFLFS